MDKIEETIKEIALKHGIAVGRDDPILILHTINERLMRETAAAQRQILHEFKEEIESAAYEWEATAKKTAEKILDTALIASKKIIAEEGKKVAEAVGKDVENRLAQANRITNKARIFSMINMAISVVTLIYVATSFWVMK